MLVPSLGPRYLRLLGVCGPAVLLCVLARWRRRAAKISRAAAIPAAGVTILAQHAGLIFVHKPGLMSTHPSEKPRPVRASGNLLCPACARDFGADQGRTALSQVPAAGGATAQCRGLRRPLRGGDAPLTARVCDVWRHRWHWISMRDHLANHPDDLHTAWRKVHPGRGSRPTLTLTLTLTLTMTPSLTLTLTLTLTRRTRGRSSGRWRRRR
jgi:hypothetical protein